MAEQESQKRNLKIAVENFGPIRAGSVELKPLTIFIGPNNTGKSYMALLVYALWRGLRSRPVFFAAAEQDDADNASRREALEWMNLYAEGGEISLARLPEQLQAWAVSLLTDSVGEVSRAVTSSLVS